MCNGYVGADLQALCREAVVSALSHVEGVRPVEMKDFEEAHKRVLGLASCEVQLRRLLRCPGMTWAVYMNDSRTSGRYPPASGSFIHVLWNGQSSMVLQGLGSGLHEVSFCMAHPVVPKLPLQKLLLILLKSPFLPSDLYSKYVGEGEALLRDTFRQARLAPPSIISFDEADAVASRRGLGENGSAGGGSDTLVGEKLLSALLTGMDGLELAQGVLVLAATNRPQAIDAALMRPGRFDSVLYVSPPDKESRLEILRVHTRRNTVADDVDLEIVADSTEYFTGAELAGLCREAVMAALRESL